MRTKEELKKTEGYWVETLENAFCRAGVKRYVSTTKNILKTIRFDVNNPIHILEIQNLIDALELLIDNEHIKEIII
jgi:hypothetical protein